MSIPLITNFTINQNAPIDDRIIVTNSFAKDSIQYKYDGLTIFQTSDRSSWTWNATSATWSYNVSGNGIYSGSGSVVGDTYINLNSISTGAVANTTSNLLGYYSNLIGGSIYYLNTFAVKKSGSPSSQLSFKIQNSLNSTNYSYIEFNPDSTDIGSIAIGNNATEYLRISNTGNLNLWKGNLILWSPTYSITFNTNYLGANNIYYLPNNSGTLAMIGDVSTLAATVSAISLQTVTNVGATTSKPVTILSSLSVGSTFSIGSDFIFNNKQEIVYTDSSVIPSTTSSRGYIINGVCSGYIYWHGHTSTESFTTTYGSVIVPANCSIVVEAIFNSTCSNRTYSGFTSTLYSGYWRQNKIINTYSVDGSGNITLQNTINIFQYTNDTVYTICNYATVVSPVPYNLSFSQSLNNPGVNNNYDLVSRVEYKIFISPYTTG